jgi:hypothetical protein
MQVLLKPLVNKHRTDVRDTKNQKCDASVFTKEIRERLVGFSSGLRRFTCHFTESLLSSLLKSRNHRSVPSPHFRPYPEIPYALNPGIRVPATYQDQSPLVVVKARKYDSRTGGMLSTRGGLLFGIRSGQAKDSKSAAKRLKKSRFSFLEGTPRTPRLWS